MATYGERLATFTSFSISWPHKSPRPEDLAAAGFEYAPSKYDRDDVRCSQCRKQFCDWEPHEDPVSRHLKYSPRCSLAKDEAEKPTPTTQDLAVFNPSLQQNFPDIYLFRDIDKFAERLLECKDQYREKDILELLLKCLRGPAFVWSQGIQETLKHADLSKHMEALTAKFNKHPAILESLPQPAPGSSINRASFERACWRLET